MVAGLSIRCLRWPRLRHHRLERFRPREAHHHNLGPRSEPDQRHHVDRQQDHRIGRARRQRQSLGCPNQLSPNIFHPKLKNNSFPIFMNEIKVCAGGIQIADI